MRRIWHILFLALIPLASLADDCPRVKIKAERLPDLNIPRNSHSAVCINGEVTVFGGHTTNFIPTQTAEYFKDGEWHLMEMAYPHDNGLCVVLRSGKVLLGGGHSDPMGVGRSYNVEEYDPETHTFRGFCIMSMKRTFASGVELDSGRVVVAGNWYGNDSIEMFDGDRTFSPVKGVNIPHAVPYLLHTSDGNVLILGNESPYHEPLCNDSVERLKGGPLRVPILNKWQPLTFEAPFCNDLSWIGDESKDDYSYLINVQDWSHNTQQTWEQLHREMAFMLVRDTTFSILPTTCPIPLTGVSSSDSIFYYSPLIADRKAHRGYVHGSDLKGRSYVLCVEYDKTPAPLTLYYTDPLPDAGAPMIVLTADGDLMMVGGHNYNKTLGGELDNDNFSPLATAYLLPVGLHEHAKEGTAAWPWIVLIVVLAAAAALVLLWRKRRTESETVIVDAPESIGLTNDSEELMRRICELMEQEQLYLNNKLKLTDVAKRLGSNRNVISACINTQCGYSFSQFISKYRVEHAKELLRQHPDLKIAEVWMESGFTTESSFFRAFKAITGMTPSDLKAQND
ncbi:MAG: helix-turn-helix domain-containing protein [Bacteroidaceae bacterium]|nr:helix-turn-helix domain-containing protein [Bacteroidaceae bacterium]